MNYHTELETSKYQHIALIPFYKSWKNNTIFNVEFGRDNVLQPFEFLKDYFYSRNILINTIDLCEFKNSDYFIFLRIDLIILIRLFFSGKLNRSIYIQFEPPVTEFLHHDNNLKIISKIFAKVVTWNDSLIDNLKFYKFYYPIPNYNSFKWLSYDDKKFLTCITSNKKSIYKDEIYSYRKDLIYFFNNQIPDSFDLFGIGWGNERLKVYKGIIDRKHNVLSKYKYAICFENMVNIDGLVSEKILDCLIVGTVPIYLGANNIEQYIPENCYIDMRKFDSYSLLLEYLQKITKAEYSEIQKNIRQFLTTDQFINFTPKNFSKNLLNVVRDIDCNAKNNVFVQFTGIVCLTYLKVIKGVKKIYEKIY